TLAPLDIESVIASVAKTNRAVIVHEDNLTGGVGGEIAALLAERAFQLLDAPIKRVASLDTPTPFSPVLEEYYLPTAEKIKAAVIETLAF
ncbi:alpha-ketoacid dehydrogenase subunit beta, partial [candidate division KSB1 bacterium]|nr:alpha-ketoacid dehydrogenase subunit beta [candidate division KSB1 bacterium]